MADIALTTFDNPYDPFTQFDEWYAFDTQKQYNSCAYLARVSQTAIDLPDSENQKELEKAIDEICELNPSLYKKVERKV